MSSTTVLVLLISISISFIIVYGRRNFFKKKDHIYSSNTKRGFALLLDFTALNAFNFLYILLKAFFDAEYAIEFAKFADHIFHSGGVGLFTWFIKTQGMLLIIYTIYSTIFELSPLRATYSSYHLGLVVKKQNGDSASFVQVLIRNILKPISITVWPVFAFVSNFNSTRSWIHDLASQTAVVEKEKLA